MNRFRWLLVAASLLIGSATASNGNQLLILSEQDLSQQWRPDGPTVVHFDLSARSIKFEYGCVNLGFVVEKDGSVSPPLRLLAYGFNQPIGSGPSDETLFSELAGLLPKFLPTSELKPAVYTSLSIPVRNEKFSKTLTPQQSSSLDQALRNACRIDNLAARLTTGGREAERITLPAEIETLLSSSR